MNQKISEFFVERKTAYLKAKIKPSLSPEEEAQILAASSIFQVFP